MVTARLTSKGRLTIPKSVRESLHLHQGDRVMFIVDDQGGATLRPLSKKVDDVFGKLQTPEAKPVSVEEMNEAVLARMKARAE